MFSRTTPVPRPQKGRVVDTAASVRVNVDMKSSGEGREISIGELAEHFGLATHVLRHWE